MITKEKRAEYNKRYREKHPEKCRERQHKKRIKELAAKTKAQDIVIAELRQELEKVKEDARGVVIAEFRQEIEKAEREAAEMRKKYQRAKCLNDKVREYITYSLRGTEDYTILVGLHYIYKKEEEHDDEQT